MLLPWPTSDHVAFVAAQHDVAAAAGGDPVHSAIVERGRLDQPERDRQARELRLAGRGGGDLAAVADHQVVAVAGVDRVAEASADDDVLAAPVVISSAPPATVVEVLSIRSMSEASVSVSA